MNSDAPPQHPWWMWVVASSYVLTFGLALYLIFWGAAELRGVSTTFADEAVTVSSVEAGSPESIAGVQVGDRLVAIDGRPIRGLRDWVAATGNVQVDEPQRWLVVRGEDRLDLEIVPEQATIRRRLQEGYVNYLSLAVTGLVLGLLIAWKRPNDAVGGLGAWFMMTAAMAFGFPFGWAATWRALPAAVQGLLWIPQFSRFVLEGILLSFFLVFPQRLVRHWWLWLAVWVPVLATLPFRVKSFYGVIHPEQVEPVPAWILQVGFARTVLYLLTAVAVLAVGYRRLSSLDEKRRVRVLTIGTTISMVSATLTVLIDNFVGRSQLYTGGLGVLFYAVTIPLNTACPLSLAYAILRHRALDISIIIRQGLQYMFARGAVIGLVPLFGAALVVDLAVNSQQPLAEVLRTRGWLYATAVGLSLMAYWKRKAWLEAIDRRFFRERYDAQRVLREVLDETRTAREFGLVAPRVVERLEAAFHAEFITAMVRQPEDSLYTSLASSPRGSTTLRLSAESKIVGLMRVLGKPLEIHRAGRSWLGQQLPREELSSLREARVELLVPVSIAPGQREALLTLGAKRSEEPYTPEDLEFLETIAATLALLVDTPPTTHAMEKSPGVFHECPTCGLCYESSVASCGRDGAILIPMDAPRVLAGRYRLERRRGRGGMGTVYEAVDDELERRVAIKLIRDDWANHDEATARFRREARVAARFAHPNVVTVHDYGVEGDRRAFLVMELLAGASLRDELARHGRLAPERIVEILRGVCAGVEAAHQHDLIHRDIKPANIFLAKSGDGTETVKVLDFGIAKFLPAFGESTPTRTRIETATGVLIGTPAYMSPEQILGMELNRAWDLWALAVVIYQALAGALPFGQEGATDWQRAVIAGDFTPVAEHLPEAQLSWDSFFRRCFSTDPTNRPGSAAELLHCLEQTLTSRAHNSE